MASVRFRSASTRGSAAEVVTSARLGAQLGAAASGGGGRGNVQDRTGNAEAVYAALEPFLARADGWHEVVLDCGRPVIRWLG